MNKSVSTDLLANADLIREVFPEATASDIKTDFLKVGEREAMLCFINGSTDTDAMIEIEKNLLSASVSVETMSELMRQAIPFNDKKEEKEINKLISALLASMSILFVDGFDSAVILDTKKYPSRGISEPEKNKTLRGPRDGFSESVYTNTALIRRRIKSPDLSFEAFDIGSATKTRVILAYMKGKAGEELIVRVRDKLSNMNLKSLTLPSFSFPVL